MTDEERTIMTEENRRLIQESAKILAWGVKMGLISYPSETEDPNKCNPPPCSLIDLIPQSSSNSSVQLNTGWPNSDPQ